MCTMEFQSALKKYEVLPFATTWMDAEITMQILCKLYVESKKQYNESISKTKQTQRQKTDMISKEERNAGINQEYGIWKYRPLYIYIYITCKQKEFTAWYIELYSTYCNNLEKILRMCVYVCIICMCVYIYTNIYMYS